MHLARYIVKRWLVILLLAGLLASAWPPAALSSVSPPDVMAGQTTVEVAPQQDVAPDAAAAGEAFIYSYAAKFVCTEALPPGQFHYGLKAPIVQQKTDVLVHNPNGYPVELYKKAVVAPVQTFGQIPQGTAPGKWYRVTLSPDYAFRIDCDDIAKLLTGNAAATFAGTYGLGATVEGFVVIGIGFQGVPGTPIRRQGVLDVTAEYVRSSEVLKKDIHFQSWWWWWWWPLPWRLGYAYQRILPIDSQTNIDCRGLLYDALAADVGREMGTGQEANLTLQALNQGKKLDPTNVADTTAEAPPALVALVGRCDKISTTAMSVDYVLVSNKGSTDNDPRGGTAVAVAVRYPWIAGRWYDIALVTPQNYDVDIHDHFRTWESQRWIASGADKAAVQQAMVYWFPYWCGWGYWWWWNAGDCIDIGVGEGESLDVEQVIPTRVFVGKWPPAQ